ncbi:hypothetical protein pipiens_016029 [Culex pipiens pipiens]|uniref:Uncharacterized protein n=1 Tax=Culex pipiens pipiens TaxID=38569 RepID=A0ABD1CPJ3_CULPP|nr:uncharacterized protein LOC119769431 [Culex quinquefasciatus]
MALQVSLEQRCPRNDGWSIGLKISVHAIFVEASSKINRLAGRSPTCKCPRKDAGRNRLDVHGPMRGSDSVDGRRPATALGTTDKMLHELVQIQINRSSSSCAWSCPSKTVRPVN